MPKLRKTTHSDAAAFLGRNPIRPVAGEGRADYLERMEATKTRWLHLICNYVQGEFSVVSMEKGMRCTCCGAEARHDNFRHDPDCIFQASAYILQGLG